jgi:hypothetical protein
MVAVAIFSTDPVLRRNLEQLPHDDADSRTEAVAKAAQAGLVML